MTISALTPFVIQSFSVLTIVAFVLSVVALVALFHGTGRQIFQDKGLKLMFITSLLAMLGSLYFSDIAGWNPCKDCWLQRIVMYPQALLLLIALVKKDRGIAPYILVLSLIGIILSTHHYWEQVEAAMKPLDPLVPCDTTGESCAATKIHFTFGFITIPMMALSVFVLNALTSTILLKKKS